MKEISIQQYIQKFGGDISWQDIIQLIIPLFDQVSSQHDPSMFQQNIRLEQVFIDTETNHIKFESEKVSLDAATPEDSSAPEYLPWELYNPWSHRGSSLEVYSLAVCLYTAISGNLPPKAVDRVEGAPLVSFTEFGKTIPDEVESVLFKGLALNGSDRYETVEEFQAALITATHLNNSEELIPLFSPEGEEKPVLSSAPLSIDQIKMVPSVALSDAPTTSRSVSTSKSTSFLTFVPALAVVGAFFMGVLGYQIASRTMFAVTATPSSLDATFVLPSSAALNEPTSNDILPQNSQTIQYEDGSVYEGEWQKDARDGYGVLTLANGNVYEGNWVADSLEGNAKISYILDAEQEWTVHFEGQFVSNEPQGTGVYQSVDGHTQTGRWCITENKELSWTAENTQRNLPAQYRGLLNGTLPSGCGQAVWLIDSDHTATYTGEWENGVPAGKGTFQSVSGTSLSGNWSYASGLKVTSSEGMSGTYTGLLLEGVPSGLGITVWGNGDVSLTEYSNGLRSGYGISYGKNGGQCVGLWDADTISNGTGTYTYADGSRFSGTWSGLQKTGTLMTSSGETFTGTWKNGQLNGKGTYANRAGEAYNGNWFNGKMSGTGTYKWANGDCYTGSWSNDQPHGTGTMYYANGDSYAGLWTNGQHADTGNYKWASGESYEGTLVNGSKEGSGTYVWANGDFYTGNWSNNQPHGKGTFQYATGDSYTGNWANGQRSGIGTYRWSNGDSYTGAWTNDQKNGAGTYTWANGTTYKSTWVNNFPLKGGTYTYTDEGVSELLVSGSLTMCS